MRNLLASFFSEDTVTLDDVGSAVARLINEGLPVLIDDLMEDPRYFDRHGHHGVPRYLENTGLFN